MVLVCQGCGSDFEAKRSHARFCSPKCRKRGSRAADPPAAVEGLEAATRRELVRLGKVNTVLGQQALAVSSAMAAGRDTGSVIASLSKELSRLMVALGSSQSGDTAGDEPVDPLDEVRKRREQKESRARETSG